MTDSEKGTPRSGTPETDGIPEPVNAAGPSVDIEETVAADPDVSESASAPDPDDVPDTGLSDEPVEELAFVPAEPAVAEAAVAADSDEIENSSAPDPDDVPDTGLSDEPVEELAFVPAEPAAAEAAVATVVKTTRRVRQPVQAGELPSRYAVIKTGGKQYRVKVGDRIQVERLHADAGTDVTLDEVLMLGGTGVTQIGTPIVDGASVSAHIDEHGRGEKIVVFKFKAKKRYRRRTGHRQELTRLTITGISG